MSLSFKGCSYIVRFSGAGLAEFLAPLFSFKTEGNAAN
jgi:hypothetical protein